MAFPQILAQLGEVANSIRDSVTATFTESADRSKLQAEATTQEAKPTSPSSEVEQKPSSTPQTQHEIATKERMTTVVNTAIGKAQWSPHYDPSKVTEQSKHFSSISELLSKHPELAYSEGSENGHKQVVITGNTLQAYASALEIKKQAEKSNLDVEVIVLRPDSAETSLLSIQKAAMQTHADIDSITKKFAPEGSVLYDILKKAGYVEGSTQLPHNLDKLIEEELIKKGIYLVSDVDLATVSLKSEENELKALTFKEGAERTTIPLDSFIDCTETGSVAFKIEPESQFLDSQRELADKGIINPAYKDSLGDGSLGVTPIMSINISADETARLEEICYDENQKNTRDVVWSKHPISDPVNSGATGDGVGLSFRKYLEDNYRELIKEFGLADSSGNLSNEAGSPLLLRGANISEVVDPTTGEKRLAFNFAVFNGSEEESEFENGAPPTDQMKFVASAFERFLQEKLDDKDLNVQLPDRVYYRAGKDRLNVNSAPGLEEVLNPNDEYLANVTSQFSYHLDSRGTYGPLQKIVSANGRPTPVTASVLPDTGTSKTFSNVSYNGAFAGTASTTGITRIDTHKLNVSLTQASSIVERLKDPNASKQEINQRVYDSVVSSQTEDLIDPRTDSRVASLNTIDTSLDENTLGHKTPQTGSQQIKMLLSEERATKQRGEPDSSNIASTLKTPISLQEIFSDRTLNALLDIHPETYTADQVLKIQSIISKLYGQDSLGPSGLDGIYGEYTEAGYSKLKSDLTLANSYKSEIKPT
jgi:hypothetical protein